MTGSIVLVVVGISMFVFLIPLYFILRRGEEWTEDDLYEVATDELLGKEEIKMGLWRRVLTLSFGDKEKAKYMYINKRVKQLAKEYEVILSEDTDVYIQPLMKQKKLKTKTILTMKNQENTEMLSFSGRIGRMTYWVEGLVISLGIIMFTFGMNIWFEMIHAEVDYIYMSVSILGTFIFIFILLDRDAQRWHDLNQTGWLSLLILVPFVNFVTILFLGFIRGSVGSNHYGEDPVG